MASRKKDKTGRKSGQGRRSNKGGPEDSASAQNERFVKKYYPVFENLVLFVLGRGEYWEALKAFLKREFSYRGAIVGKGMALFFVTLTFLIGGAVFFILGLFFFFRDLTESSTIAAFIMTLLSLVLGLIFFLLSVNIFRRLFEKHPEQSAETEE